MEVRSTRGALPVSPPVGFPEPPPAPAVPVSKHRALHKPRHANGAAWSGSPVPVAPPDTAQAPVRRCSPASFGHSSVLPADLLVPFAMCTPLACSDYYGTSAPPNGHQSATDLPPAGPDTRGRATVSGSHVHLEWFDKGGARLYSDSIAMATPQSFTMASPPDRSTGFGVDQHRRTAPITRCTPAPIRQV